MYIGYGKNLYEWFEFIDIKHTKELYFKAECYIFEKDKSNIVSENNFVAKAFFITGYYCLALPYYYFVTIHEKTESVMEKHDQMPPMKSEGYHVPFSN